MDRIRGSLGYCAGASAWARASTEAEASAGISAEASASAGTSTGTRAGTEASSGAGAFAGLEAEASPGVRAGTSSRAGAAVSAGASSRFWSLLHIPIPPRNTSTCGPQMQTPSPCEPQREGTTCTTHHLWGQLGISAWFLVARAKGKMPRPLLLGGRWEDRPRLRQAAVTHGLKHHSEKVAEVSQCHSRVQSVDQGAQGWDLGAHGVEKEKLNLSSVCL